MTVDKKIIMIKDFARMTRSKCLYNITMSILSAGNTYSEYSLKYFYPVSPEKKYLLEYSYSRIGYSVLYSTPTTRSLVLVELWILFRYSVTEDDTPNKLWLMTPEYCIATVALLLGVVHDTIDSLYSSTPYSEYAVRTHSSTVLFEVVWDSMDHVKNNYAPTNYYSSPVENFMKSKIYLLCQQTK
jgi:hypothetical protein